MNNKNKFEYEGINKIPIILTCIYIFICPYENYINNLIGSKTKYLLIGIITAYIIILYKNNYMLKFNIYHYSFLAWIYMEVFSCFYGGYNSQIASQFIGRLSVILFLLIITSINFSQKCMQYFLNTLYFSNTLMAILFVIFPRFRMSVGGVRYTFSIMGEYTDPNNVAAFFIIGASIAIYKSIYERKNLILNTAYLSISIMAIFLTGSRAGFLSLVVIMIISNIYNIEFRIDNVVKMTFKLIGVFILSYLLLRIMIIFIDSNVLERILEFETYEGGSHRSYIWEETMKAILNRPLFGHGWGVYIYNQNISEGIHNTFLVILHEVGFIGLSFIIIGLAVIVYNAKRNKSILPLIILITGIAPSFFIDASNKRFFWNAIIFSYIFIRYKVDNPKVNIN